MALKKKSPESRDLEATPAPQPAAPPAPAPPRAAPGAAERAALAELRCTIIDPDAPYWAGMQQNDPVSQHYVKLAAQIAAICDRLGIKAATPKAG